MFRVVFRGEIAAGADLADVKARLAALYRTDVAHIEAMFGRGEVVVRKQADAATARQVVEAFRQAGAICRLDPLDPQASTPPSAADPPNAKGTDGSEKPGARATGSAPVPGPTHPGGFRVVWDGTPARQGSREEAAGRLAARLGLTAQELLALLDAGPIVVRDWIEEREATGWRAELAALGASAVLRRTDPGASIAPNVRRAAIAHCERARSEIERLTARIAETHRRRQRLQAAAANLRQARIDGLGATPWGMRDAQARVITAQHDLQVAAAAYHELASELILPDKIALAVPTGMLRAQVSGLDVESLIPDDTFYDTLRSTRSLGGLATENTSLLEVLQVLIELHNVEDAIEQVRADAHADFQALAGGGSGT